MSERQSTTYNSAHAAPQVIDKIIGQKQAVDLLKVSLAAYWNDRAAGRRPAFGHVLMVGGSGLGKTTLAKCLAAELGGQLRECLGQTLGLAEDLHGVLLEATDETVLFIDEAALLSEYAQHLLLKACDERVIQISRSPVSRKYVNVPLSNFTLVLATTHEAELLPALRNRMKLTLRFDYYSNEELAEVCRQRAQALHWAVEPDVFPLIARRSKFTPRLAIRLLESCYRTSRAEAADAITVEHLHRTVALEGLTGDLGLDKTERQYLEILAGAKGKAIRLNVLASKLGLDRKTISEVAEQFLLREGLISRSESGRMLTEKGLTFVAQQLPQSSQSNGGA